MGVVKGGIHNNSNTLPLVLTADFPPLTLILISLKAIVPLLTSGGD